MIPEVCDEGEYVHYTLFVQLLAERVDGHVRARPTHTLANNMKSKYKMCKQQILMHIIKLN